MGRLSLYTVGLSQNVKDAIAETARKCSDILEEWSKSDSFKRLITNERINRLCETSLNIANKGALQHLVHENTSAIVAWL